MNPTAHWLHPVLPDTTSSPPLQDTTKHQETRVSKPSTHAFTVQGQCTATNAFWRTLTCTPCKWTSLPHLLQATRCTAHTRCRSLKHNPRGTRHRSCEQSSVECPRGRAHTWMPQGRLQWLHRHSWCRLCRLGRTIQESLSRCHHIAEKREFTRRKGNERASG
jgi:hypothetical protein